MSVVGYVPRAAMHAVLSAMMADRGALDLGLAALRPDAMAGQPGHVLKALREMHAAGKPVDTLTVTEHLRTAGTLDVAGGPAMVAEISDSVGTIENLEAQCSIVNAAAARFALRTAVAGIHRDIDGLDPTDQVIDRAEKALLGVRDADPKRITITPLHRIMERVLEQTDGGLKTGISKLDWCTGGLHPGNLVVIGARPGIGKTLFVTCVARNIAARGLPVLFVSVEMREKEIGQRLVAMHGIPLSRVIEHPEDDDVAHAAVRVAQLPIQVVHIADAKIIDVRATIRRIGYQPAVVIVDYLQITRSGEKFFKRHEEVGRVAYLLKRLAEENNVPVIAAAQVGRAVEDRGKLRRPMLSDLRESGDIESHANVVAFIHRPKPQESSNTEAEIIVAKNRQGPVGIGSLVFRGEYVSFDNPMQGGTQQELGSF